MLNRAKKEGKGVCNQDKGAERAQKRTTEKRENGMVQAANSKAKVGGRLILIQTRNQLMFNGASGKW